MASICCSPPLSRPASWVRRSRSTGKSSVACSMRSRLSVRPTRVVARAARRFSSTVREGNSSRDSATSDSPLRSRRWLGTVVTV